MTSVSLILEVGIMILMDNLLLWQRKVNFGEMSGDDVSESDHYSDNVSGFKMIFLDRCFAE